MSDERIPAAGEPISEEDLDNVLEAVRARQVNFPDEPAVLSFGVVLMNIGDRYTKVRCINGEWEGLKLEIPKGEGIPTCPNDHPLIEAQTRLRLGWIEVSD